MKKIIFTVFGLILLGSGGYFIYHNNKTSTQNKYYEKLAQECNSKEDKQCCLDSLERMRSGGTTAIDSNTGVCDYGYEREMLNCADSFAWCKPLTINETNKVSFYQNLKDNCKKTRTDSNQLSCCLDSVKTMEIVGSTKLFPGGKYEENGEYDCGNGLSRMALRCPGSYAWCQTLNNPSVEDAVPVPIDVPRIEPTQPENPGPGFDDDGNGPICTADAKQCPDGTYVGRTSPNCEFAKCPRSEPEPDFIPTKDNSIHLPDNVMTEKECTEVGGEVWNTLGETTYDGKLIGKIEGLNCPCACLIKNK